MLALALIACQEPAGQPASLNLGRRPELIEVLELPASSLPGRAPRGRVELVDWGLRGDAEGVYEWQAEIPLRWVDTGHTTRKQPVGLDLEGQEGLDYKRLGGDGLQVDTWEVRSGWVLIRTDSATPPQGLTLSYAVAEAIERRLSLEASGLSDLDFALSPVKPETDSARGLLLPAPGRVVWRVTVPRSGLLAFDGSLLGSPWTDEAPSDGAELRVSVDGQLLRSVVLRPGQLHRARVDLSDWGGQQVALEIETRPGDSPDFDSVFLTEPALYTPGEPPRRVVLVFIDTLRADRLGSYGYETRDTTPALDAWARDARLFEQAVAPSPWTLPSARSALSGRLPEGWEPSENLPALLADQGFLTQAFVTNAFLGTSYDMGSSWAHYGYDFLAPAGDQVDRAIAALSEWPDRDQLLMVHFLDTHLPYREPSPYSELWVGELPEALEGVGLGRTELQRLNHAQSREARPYLEARYDQSLRYVDAELERLLAQLGPQDIVVVFSDHGEEFWDHGGFEHGHALYEELVHVPLILKGPGVTPGREATPVGLIDLAPTVLELLDLPAPDMDGQSLLAPTPQRPLAMGYGLYGREMWAVRRGSDKWTHTEGRSRVSDLEADPGEAHRRRPSADEDEAWAQALAEGLGRPVHAAWRLWAGSTRRFATLKEASVRVEGPDLRHAVAAWDPLDTLAAPRLEDGAVVISGPEGGFLPAEFFVVPADPLDLTGVSLAVQTEDHLGEASYEGQAAPRDGLGRSLLYAGRGSTAYRLGHAWVPAQVESSMPGISAESEGQLQVLGYLD